MAGCNAIYSSKLVLKDVVEGSQNVAQTAILTDMQIPPCFYRVSVKALILDDQGRFLLAKEPDGKWDLPGGGLEFAENPQLAIRREVTEELGLHVLDVKTQPTYFTTFKKTNTDIWMANAVYETTVENLEFKTSDECEEIQFFTPQEAEALDNYGGVTKLAAVFMQD